MKQKRILSLKKLGNCTGGLDPVKPRAVNELTPADNRQPAAPISSPSTVKATTSNTPEQPKKVQTVKRLTPAIR